MDCAGGKVGQSRSSLSRGQRNMDYAREVLDVGNLTFIGNKSGAVEADDGAQRAPGAPSEFKIDK